GQGRRIASRPARLDRRAGTAVRVLSERSNHDGQGVARQESEPDRCRYSRGHERDALPLHDLLPRAGRDQTGCGRDVGGHRWTEGRRGMRTFTAIPAKIEDLLEEWNGSVSRRTFLKGSGLLVVSLGTTAIAGPIAEIAYAQPRGGPYPDPDFHQLDSWTVIRPHNNATFYVGKTDCGQGTGTSFRQMMS